MRILVCPSRSARFLYLHLPHLCSHIILLRLLGVSATGLKSQRQKRWDSVLPSDMSMWAALYTIANKYGTEVVMDPLWGTLDTGQSGFYIIVRRRQFR